MKKKLSLILSVLIGFATAIPAIAIGINVTVPSAPSSGYSLVSTSTGAYIASTTDPFHVGSLYASSTTATSTFKGGVSTAGLASTAGLTITGGSIVDTSTGTSTFSNGISLSSGCFFYNGACLTASGSGTVTSITAGNQLNTLGGVNPITGAGTLGFNSSFTFGTASGTLISATSTIYVGSTATTTIVGNNATSTFKGGISTSGGGGLASDAGLTITGGSLGCTGCVPNASLGNSTISGVSLGGTLAALTIGTGLTSGGTYTGATTRTASLDTTVANAWTPTATTTFSGGLYAGKGLAAPTISATSTTGTSTISGGLQYQSMTVYPYGFGGLPFASSTLAYIGSYSSTASTSVRIGNFPTAFTMLNFFCKTDVGTANVEFGTGSATTSLAVCSTAGVTVTLSTNNTWTPRQDLFVRIGDSVSSPNVITVSPSIQTN